jgi:hypothetical protein
MTITGALIFFSLAWAVPLASTASAQQRPSPDLCIGCIQIRVGPPIVLRGPAPDEIDAPFSQIKLRSGQFRGFTANGTTYAVDGSTPYSMGGPRRAVIGPGPKGSISDCGNWLTGTVQKEGKLYGFLHNEQACDYRENQTRKSMSIATSVDEGLTWTILGPIISGSDVLTPGRSTGVGDCTAVDGQDGYLYAYCLRLSDWKTIVARAPAADPLPGRWVEWDGAGWSVPALGGSGASIGAVGVSAAYWAEQNAILLIGGNSALGLSLSVDKLQFKPLAEPLINSDGNDWNRPAATHLYAYPNLLGDDGTNRISNQARLTYTYLPPGEDFSQRYLVMHDVRLTIGRVPVAQQVGVALTRWINNADGRRWTTTAPPIEDRSARAYRHEMQLGYLMTAAPALPSHKLEECVGDQLGGRDHMLATDGGCSVGRYRHYRTAGFAYRDRQPGTIPLYSCVAPSDHRHFSSTDPACEKLGVQERRLGFILSR